MVSSTHLMSRIRSITVIVGSFIVLSLSFCPQPDSAVRDSNLLPKFHRNLAHLNAQNQNDDLDASGRSLLNSNLMAKDSIIKQTVVLISCLSSSIILPAVSNALTTDNLLVDKMGATNGAFDPIVASQFAAEVEKNRALNSDEFIVKFENVSLGLGLTEVYYKGFPVVTVSSIRYPLNNPNDPEFRASNPLLKVGAIVIGVEGNNTDGTPLKKISEYIKAAPRPVNVKFRDPSRYFELLDSASGAPLKVITTSYLPANARDPGAPEQVIRVERLELPPPEDRRRASVMLDVMEIQYVAQIPGSDVIVDSSKERTSGSTAGSIYYILGQQNGPPGKLPPGWDLTLRGMVVGEKRRITLPYTLAYDRAGSKDKKIPPFSQVVYTVRLVSLT